MRMDPNCPDSGLPCKSRIMFNELSDALYVEQMENSLSGFEMSWPVRALSKVIRGDRAGSANAGMQKVERLVHQADEFAEANTECSRTDMCMTMWGFTLATIQEAIPDSSIRVVDDLE